MVDRLPHHPRHRPPLTPDLGRDRHVGQPPLLQVVHCTSGHGSQHPPLPPASQRGEQFAATPGTFSVRMDGASSLRIYTTLAIRHTDRRDGGTAPLWRTV